MTVPLKQHVSFGRLASLLQKSESAIISYHEVGVLGFWG